MKQVYLILIALGLSFVSGCVDYSPVHAAQAEQLSRLAHEDRELRIAANVVVEKLREVESKNEWQKLASLEPQIYQLASDLLNTAKTDATYDEPSHRYLGDSLPRISQQTHHKLPVLLPLVTRSEHDKPKLVETSTPAHSEHDTSRQTPPALKGARSMFFALHLGSYRDEQRAFAGWQELKAKAPVVFDGMSPRVERVDLGVKGVFMRLKAGPILSEMAVNAKCQSLIAKKISCARADFTGKDQS